MLSWAGLLHPALHVNCAVSGRYLCATAHLILRCLFIAYLPWAAAAWSGCDGASIPVHVGDLCVLKVFTSKEIQSKLLLPCGNSAVPMWKCCPIQICFCLMIPIISWPPNLINLKLKLVLFLKILWMCVATALYCMIQVVHRQLSSTELWVHEVLSDK